MIHRKSLVILRFALALALGIGAGLAFKLLLPSTAGAAEYAGLEWRASNSSLAFSPFPGLSSFADAPAASRLDAVLLVAGVEHDPVSDQIALPDGTRFQLQVTSERDGWLEIYAVNPNGVSRSAPLWSGRVRADSPVTTSMLRLQGTRGLETLELILRGPGRRELAQRQVQILHL